MLASIIRLVEQAQGSKARVQRLADTVAGIFVPAVLIIAALTFVDWSVAGYMFGYLPPMTASQLQSVDRGAGRGYRRAGGRLPLCARSGDTDGHHGGHRTGR